ncbi:meprin A subunit beta-like [Sardina pilchardus]|uniref:meprin A subunit beta-like n=1 Tax=Sardina pilchardus TaxID=27697 RepID=UPI002E135C71
MITQGNSGQRVPNACQYGGLDLFEGDIRISRRGRSIRSEQHRWPLPVPYDLEESLDINAKGVILRAFEQFRLKTCIDFRPRCQFEQYIAIKNDTGCWSYIGRTMWRQELSIDSDCVTVASVEHELMHALGFWHEQSRYDRDNYISINWENIEAGEEDNFKIKTNDTNSTMDTPYDYLSVMHYYKDAFSNGNGSTIITKLPEFQDVIGQRLDMSHYDVEELNKLYGCKDSISFLNHCSFDEDMCEMSSAGWKRVRRAGGGPQSDHTYLGMKSQNSSFFMHSNTKRGQRKFSILQARRLTPRRTSNIQCLEFFYYNSGNEMDQLNIWMTEFDSEYDTMGTRRLMGQVTGSPADYWQLHYVPLNATKTFQVEFEARKGTGESSGGFSVDDINLSETECPHQTWQIRNFEKLMSEPETIIYSPTYYTSDGYRYQIFLEIHYVFMSANIRLVSGDFDDQLQWPLEWRQMTLLVLDQTPDIRQRMSNQFSFTTDSANGNGKRGTTLNRNHDIENDE